MKKLLMILVLFIFAGMPVLVSDENDENERTYWIEEDVEYDGRIINMYYAKTTEQFLYNLYPTMKKELSINDYYRFDARLVFNNFISKEGIKKNYPKSYKYMMENTGDGVLGSHQNDFSFYWCGYGLSESSYMVIAGRNLNNTKYVSLYCNGMYTFTFFANLEKSLK